MWLLHERNIVLGLFVKNNKKIKPHCYANRLRSGDISLFLLLNILI